ncbi:signal recognition particle-docking protein FtsY [Proteus mirabilis]|uniref:signal recognition particle-docking protein FtsY n=1 Tax=Proteus mirabilis TaxID=584 RepID=UPI0019D05FB2|nr:signal recognition particle-docking protein FtsY [Proteus mirabilis]MBN7188320.1 signal recognition particle-docking protein FtsY [Proteus mirabilis]MBN7241988.1 signal recognition particle-docking protein FtsY [Proteus mirabilis]HCU2503646.1 signal recognition particle-docking protein FtsY [Proteus mirabilis]HEJ9729701.1 signal recognition particle-docking protein FtsY [Proteus mirabilis]HEK0679576.1 signal recognition particle-docking protein FtsY [Proteus mirabilis]
MAKEKKGFFSWLGFGRNKEENTAQEKEQQRLEAERAEQARLAEEEAQRQAQLEAEQARQEAQRAEAERLAAERAEQVRLAEEEAQRQAQLEAEQARQEAQRAEAEKLAAERAEQARLAEEEAQRQAQLEAEQARQEAQRAEAEKLAAERAEQARLAEEEAQRQAQLEAEQARQEAQRAEAERLAAERAEQARLAEEEAQRQAQLEAEQARQEAQRAEAEKLAAERAQQARLAEEEAQRQAQLEAEQARQEAQRAEAEKLAAERAEQARLAEEEAQRQAQLEAEQARQEAQRAEAERLAAERAEQTRLAEEEAQRQAQLEAEQARQEAEAEEKARIAQAQAEAEDIVALREEVLVDKPVEQERPKKEGFFSRLKKGLLKTRQNLGSGFMGLFRGKKIDDELFEELEEQLLIADVGMDTTSKIINSLTQHASRKDLKDAESLYGKLREEMGDILNKVDKPLNIEGKKPFVILMVGVNGVGKTTTIGKLARQYQAEGKSVMLAAGDTFRAAAVEQLQVWGERNHIPVIAQHTGADPASVIFDAIQSAQAKGVDVLIADTAGRLQNKSHLMEELKKIVRVMKKLDEEAPHEVMLTLDASTGQNAVSQAKLFNETVGLTGLTLTKLDGTAKGGVIFSIADQFGIPIRYIGVGEGIEDLRPFKADDFIEALFAREE